ncbi:hypothetical protein HAX54_012193 [Datura stramonium]|uniref:Uncharacterized protein n=1 Tax=Datura stramonium TaxID=4076 RepID=A0ABS8TM50_DATST|nr:hypothetical protein [Datura stramonium]
MDPLNSIMVVIDEVSGGMDGIEEKTTNLQDEVQAFGLVQIPDSIQWDQNLSLSKVHGRGTDQIQTLGTNHVYVHNMSSEKEIGSTGVLVQNTSSDMEISQVQAAGLVQSLGITQMQIQRSLTIERNLVVEQIEKSHEQNFKELQLGVLIRISLTDPNPRIS